MAVLDKTLTNDYDIKILESDTDLEINRAKLEIDTNGNGYIDKEEADPNLRSVVEARERASVILQNRQQALKEMSTAHKMKMDEAKLALAKSKPITSK